MSEGPAEATAARQAALDYLQRHHVMSLATSGPLGLWAAAVFYANDSFELIFLSAAHSRHAQNMAAEPRVAATIQEDYDDWRAIKGIQLEGVVRLLAGAERKRAIARYRERHAFLVTAPAPVRLALGLVNWYCLSPDLLYFVDNERGFGHRDEIIAPAPAKA
jgi:uncharacterized protein